METERIARVTVPFGRGRDRDSEFSLELADALSQEPDEFRPLVVDNKLDELLHRAFVDMDSQSRFDVHRALFMIYESGFAHPMSTMARHHSTACLIEIKTKIERAWYDSELAPISAPLEGLPVFQSPALLCDWLVELAHQRTETDHWIRGFLAEEASESQLKHFLLADAPLNYRFFDALLFAATHYSEAVKSEVARHIWEECGNGNSSAAHTRQFSRILTKLGLEECDAPIWKDWRPYAGYNLYLLLGTNRRHLFKSLGSLAMPELFDPERDEAVIAGLRRIGFADQESIQYFHTHVVADAAHGGDWLRGVVCPVATGDPRAAFELGCGAAIRMWAMRQYNEYLADVFKDRLVS